MPIIDNEAVRQCYAQRRAILANELTYERDYYKEVSEEQSKRINRLRLALIVVSLWLVGTSVLLLTK